jgi:hypothetical protein
MTNEIPITGLEDSAVQKDVCMQVLCRLTIGEVMLQWN